MYKRSASGLFSKEYAVILTLDVHDEVVYGTMPQNGTMFALFLSRSLIHSNDVPFAQHDFVPHGHEPVLHVSPQSMHKMYAPVEEVLENNLTMSPVGETFP